MPLARRRMRQLVGHLVVDADDRGPRRTCGRDVSEGFTLNVNLLGEAVLGEDGGRPPPRRHRSRCSTSPTSTTCR